MKNRQEIIEEERWQDIYLKELFKKEVELKESYYAVIKEREMKI